MRFSQLFDMVTRVVRSGRSVTLAGHLVKFADTGSHHRRVPKPIGLTTYPAPSALHLRKAEVFCAGNGQGLSASLSAENT